MDKLKSQNIDKRVSLYKGIAGVIPGAGPIISEIISSIIPNQRIDRISSFLELLNNRIEQIEQEKLKSNKYFIDLFEDCIIQSSRAMSSKRNKYLAIFLNKSKNINKNNYTSKKKLFHVLQELTDEDIEVLQAHKDNRHWQLEREKSTRSISIGAYANLTDVEKYEHDLKSSLWEAHIGTLVRFNLIAAEYAVQNIEYGLEGINEHIDSDTGLPNITGYNITVLGKSLINSIYEQE